MTRRFMIPANLKLVHACQDEPAAAKAPCVGGDTLPITSSEQEQDSHKIARNEDDVFVYFSADPQKTRRRIQKFYTSLKKHAPSIDFHIVTYLKCATAGTHIFRVGKFYIPHTIYNAASIERLGYKYKTLRESGRINGGSVDLPIIAFFLDNPHYKGYWTCEDDVEYTGEIGELISNVGTANRNIALACTHVRPLPQNWDYADEFRSGSVTLPSEMVRRVCFLPFFWVSRRGLTIIDNAYRGGWAGHHEMTWPMILDLSGLAIRDFGGSGPYVVARDRNRHYIDLSPNDYSKAGSFGTMRIRLFPGRARNKLWHPVKTPRSWVRMTLKRTKSIWQWRKYQIQGALTALRVQRLRH